MPVTSGAFVKSAFANNTFQCPRELRITMPVAAYCPCLGRHGIDGAAWLSELALTTWSSIGGAMTLAGTGAGGPASPRNGRDDAGSGRAGSGRRRRGRHVLPRSRELPAAFAPRVPPTRPWTRRRLDQPPSDASGDGVGSTPHLERARGSVDRRDASACSSASLSPRSDRSRLTDGCVSS